MEKIIVSENVQRIGIVNPVACTIKNIRVLSGTTELEIEIQNLMNLLMNNPNEILSRPEVQGFASLFSVLGYPEQIPAGQRLINSLIKRGFKTYNNIVDAYNIVSAQFGSGLGMHDASAISEADILVFRANGTEEIMPMFKDKTVKVEKGDLVYGFGDELLAWLGKKDVDSDTYKITDKTTNVFLIVLGNTNTSLEYNTAICNRVYELISKTCPAATIEFTKVEKENN